MIDQNILSSTLKEQYEAFKNSELGVEREELHNLKSLIFTPQIIVITGLRRVGKSTLLKQIAIKYLKEDFYFVNFEDERLLDFEVKDFDLLHETLISLFGEKKFFLFDEIQNVPQWERFVRRLHSQELGTRLTGRSIRVELFPFSFREFLNYRQINIPDLKVLTTKQRGNLLKLTNEYIASGGIPDALKYPKLSIHKTLYDDVLYRDIATRYNIDNVKILQELAFYLISNISSMLSFNKLKDLLKLGSVNTVKNYISYLENSWLFFAINKYAYSVKEQQIAAKKLYCIDTGLAQSVGFSFSKNKGKLMENLVFLTLRRKYDRIYYYKTIQNLEVDFFVPQKKMLIQVTQKLDLLETKEREEKALVAVKQELEKINKLIIVAEGKRQDIEIRGSKIQVIPLYEWLLQN